MRIIKCDRCKEEHELDTAAAEGFRTLLSNDGFQVELCKGCMRDLYSFIWNQATKPRVKGEWVKNEHRKSYCHL